MREPANPFFSVIIPSYNDGAFLGLALDSLIAQTDRDWEAVVVNDGSTDSTREKIEDYRQKDARIRAFHKRKGGTASALNVGLEHARGDWICCLGSENSFEKNKFEIHRRAIASKPACRFFFSNFRCLHEETGASSEPTLRNDVPPDEWQILAMLKGTYIHENSICISREAWNGVGSFNEGLPHGQNYDMWLRLLARYPATFIPDRTCVTRSHDGQTSSASPEADSFASSTAAIEFLNGHAFPELVPLVDLSRPASACAAVQTALMVAGSAESPFLYGLGPHPALLLRILEWVWSDSRGALQPRLRQLVRRRARACVARYACTSFGTMWRAAYVAAKLPQSRFIYEQISPRKVAEDHYYQLRTSGNEKAEKARHFLRPSGLITDTIGDVAVPAGKEVIFVNQLGMTIGNCGIYGAVRATLEVAKCLQRRGDRVVIIAVAPTSFTSCEGVPVLGCADEESVRAALAHWGITDTVVGISRGDFLAKAAAGRVIVYHHNPHFIDGFASAPLAEALNRAHVPVLCVSRFSRDVLIAGGMRSDLLHIVPNGLDVECFKFTRDSNRCEHSMIFAGHIVGYKGFDIALRSFTLLKQRFPDAVFNAYGQHFIWRGQPIGWGDYKDNFLDPAWLDEHFLPKWEVIQREVPGFRYHGNVSKTELARAFQMHSLAVLPSRVEETFGLVSLEAQACGCLPVLPRRGAFPETLLDGVSGFLYEQNTPEALCEKITGIWTMGRPTEADRIAASQWVRSNFSWARTGALFQQVLEIIPQSRQPFRTKMLFSALWLRTRAAAKVRRVLQRTRPIWQALGLNRAALQSRIGWNGH